MTIVGSSSPIEQKIAEGVQFALKIVSSIVAVRNMRGDQLSIQSSIEQPALDQRILVIGDSHSKFWTGYNSTNATDSIFCGVDVERLGPITAYGLLAQNSPVVSALERLLGNPEKRYGLIMMCFAEVDIRAHIVTFAILRQRPLDDIVKDVAECYMEFAQRTVTKHNIPVALWGPPPSRPFEGRAYNRAIPVVGTPLERNYITDRLTDELARRCRSSDRVAFFSLFDRLIGPDYRTLPGVLYDACHMSNVNLPAAVQELYTVLDKLELQHLRACLRRKWPIAPSPSLRNLAATATWQVAQTEQGELLRADLLSAFMIREITLDVACFADMSTTLTSIDFGEEDRSVPAYSGDQAPLDPTKPLSIAIKGRQPHRFVTFSFLGKAPERPQNNIQIIVPTFSDSIK